MSRALIGGAIATAIVALTAVAYFVASSRLDARLESDARERVEIAQRLVVQNAFVDALRIQQQVERLASHPKLIEAIRAEGRSTARLAHAAFDEFIASRSGVPDIMALTNAQGNVVAMLDVANPVPTQWKNGDELEYRAIELALSSGQITSEVWRYEEVGLVKAGVAPLKVIDPETGASVILGSVVLAYAVTAVDAREQSKLVGAEVAYFHGDKVFATSFLRSGSPDEDTEMQSRLARAFAASGIMSAALQNGDARIVVAPLADEMYMATAAQLPRISTARLPEDYAPQAGAIVLMADADVAGPAKTIGSIILLVGLGSLILALLGIALTARRILSQSDQLEVGIHEIINGNIDRTFQPVGKELDGLANSLNVMLARLLGRPEPGEEEYDEEGNLVTQASVAVDEEEMSPADSAAVALAKEPEPDYYKRVFQEYVSARKEVGESGDVSYENFIAKLRLNESKLKRQYQCRAVRFKVIIKDEKVTLKPVPII